MRFLELVKYKNLATKDERILSTPKSIDPKNNWVYIYENGNVYKTGSYVEYNDEIYYVVRCPDIYKGKVTDDCYWYYGQDYEIYQMEDDKLVDTLGYEVNGVDVYDINKLAVIGSLGVGSYYYANKAIYRIVSGTYTHDAGKSSDFEAEKIAIRIGGIYAFYSSAFTKFEKGMYIINGDYVYLTYTDVDSPFSFSDRSKFEVVGVAHRDYKTCKPDLEYILFYTEYPTCYELVAGEKVLDIDKSGSSEVQSVYEIVRSVHGWSDIGNQKLIVRNRYVEYLKEEAWVYEWYADGVYPTGSWLRHGKYTDDNGNVKDKFYYVLHCPDILAWYTQDKCEWYYGNDYGIYKIDDDGNEYQIGYIVNGQEIYFWKYLDKPISAGTWFYYNDKIYKAITNLSSVTADNVIEMAVRAGGVYLFYEYAFSTFEKGMYIAHGDYVYRTLAEVKTPIDYENNSNLEVVGVRHRDYFSCTRYINKYILYYSEYPECYLLPAGELVYDISVNDDGKEIHSVYEITTPIYGKEKSLANQKLILQTRYIDYLKEYTWVYEYYDGYYFPTGAWVHYTFEDGTEKIYYVLHCPDILVWYRQDECDWYYGNDYGLYKVIDGKEVQIGYLVNGYEIYFYEKLDTINAGTYFYYEDRIYIATETFSKFDKEKVVEVAIKLGGIYAFYDWVFPKYEKGMYIIHIDDDVPEVDYAHAKDSMQVYYAIWRTLEDVEPEFDFHDTTKFEAVGVADKYCITCEDCYTRYILFYSEYPECYELVAGEVVYQEENYGYDQLGKQIIDIVNPIHGKETLDNQQIYGETAYIQDLGGIRWVRPYYDFGVYPHGTIIKSIDKYYYTNICGCDLDTSCDAVDNCYTKIGKVSCCSLLNPKFSALYSKYEYEALTTDFVDDKRLSPIDGKDFDTYEMHGCEMNLSIWSMLNIPFGDEDVPVVDLVDDYTYTYNYIYKTFEIADSSGNILQRYTNVFTLSAMGISLDVVDSCNFVIVMPDFFRCNQYKTIKIIQRIFGCDQKEFDVGVDNTYIVDRIRPYGADDEDNPTRFFGRIAGLADDYDKFGSYLGGWRNTSSIEDENMSLTGICRYPFGLERMKPNQYTYLSGFREYVAVDKRVPLIYTELPIDFLLSEFSNSIYPALLPIDREGEVHNNRPVYEPWMIWGYYDLLWSKSTGDIPDEPVKYPIFDLSPNWG